jgi:hypothetical protein
MFKRLTVEVRPEPLRWKYPYGSIICALVSPVNWVLAGVAYAQGKPPWLNVIGGAITAAVPLLIQIAMWRSEYNHRKALNV